MNRLFDFVVFLFLVLGVVVMADIVVRIVKGWFA